jgi:hypothetical protein
MMGERLMDLVLGTIKGVQDRSDQKIVALEQRVALLETELADRVHRGVFKEGEVYRRHNMVTWGGSQWHCNRSTMTRPGINDDWILAVKRGANGKDLTSR